MNRCSYGSTAWVLTICSCLAVSSVCFACAEIPIAKMYVSGTLVLPPAYGWYFYDNGSYDPDDGDPDSEQAKDAIVEYDLWIYDSRDGWVLWDSWDREDAEEGYGSHIPFPNTGVWLVLLVVRDNDNHFSAATADCLCAVYVVEVEATLGASSACDGEAVNVDLTIAPSSFESHVTSVSLTATKPGGGTDFQNPAGAGIGFSQRNPPNFKQWKIDNARWYSTQQDHCNDTSTYEIRAQVGFSFGSGGGSVTSDPVSFTVSAGGDCVNGSTGPTDPWWSGEVTYDPHQDGDDWVCTVTQGTLARDVHASTPSITCASASQYYSMVVHEEAFHVAQIRHTPCAFGACGGTSTVLSDLWDPSKIMTEIQSPPYPFQSSSRTASLSAAVTATNWAKTHEQNRSTTAFPGKKCAMEAEAKTHTGASYRGTLKCAHPECAK
jgi:hypothetical protein